MRLHPAALSLLSGLLLCAAPTVAEPVQPAPQTPPQTTVQPAAEAVIHVPAAQPPVTQSPGPTAGQAYAIEKPATASPEPSADPVAAVKPSPAPASPAPVNAEPAAKPVESAAMPIAPVVEPIAEPQAVQPAPPVVTPQPEATLSPAQATTPAAPAMATRLIGMAKESEAFKTLFLKVVELSAAQDKAGLKALFSHNATLEHGEGAVNRFLETQILPFFKEYDRLDTALTIANATDFWGNKGFSFYQTVVTKTGEQKPFVVYLVTENDQPVLANLLLHKTYADLHPDSPPQSASTP